MDSGRKGEAKHLLKRGLKHYNRGDERAAIACWEEAQALDPENKAVRDYLETAYEEIGVVSGSAPLAGGDPVGEDDETPRSYDPSVLDEENDDPDTLVAAALEAYQAGQLETAWNVLRNLSDRKPDRLDVQGYLQLVRTERAKRWAKEIGDQDRALQLKCSMDELMGRSLSSEEGFLLAQLDGNISVSDLLSLSTIDRIRMLEILARFIREGIVE